MSFRKVRGGPGDREKDSIMRLISVTSGTPIFTIRVNWAWILAFAQFWTYAVYGEVALPSFSLTAHLVTSLVLWAIFISFLFIALRHYPEYEDQIQICWRDAVVFGSYFLVLSIFTFSDLFRPLWGDPIGHSLAAIVHDRVLIEKVSTQIGLLGQINYKSAIYFINIDAILIRDVTLPLTLQTAIEQKLKQEQESLEYEFKIDKARKEAERKEIEAKGIAEFQKIVNRTITPQLLKWKGVEATEDIAKSSNAKVIVIGNGDGDLPIILGGQ